MSTPERTSRREALRRVGVSLAGVATAAAIPGGHAQAAEKAAPRWGMVVDLRRCVGCYACQVSCKMENSVPLEGFNSWVHSIDIGEYPNAKRVFLPSFCNHCEGTKTMGSMTVPPCVEVCPEYPKGRATHVTPGGEKIRYRTGATYKRPDGAILFDNDLCIGCGKCIEACPYGARYLNPMVKAGGDPTKNGIGKCTLCVHRVDEGEQPACVRSCVGKALTFGDLNDPASDVARMVREHPTKVLKPEENTKPNVYYIGLDDAAANMEASPNLQA